MSIWRMMASAKQGQYPTPILEFDHPNLAFAYDFEVPTSDLPDLSPNAETATRSGTSTTSVVGKDGNAVQYNNPASGVPTGYYTLPLDRSYTAVGVSFWLNQAGSTKGDNFVLGSFNASQVSGLAILYSGGNLILRWWAGSEFGDVALYPTDTNWHHIVATRSVGGLITVYLDGVSVGTTTTTSNNPFWVNCLGCYVSSSNVSNAQVGVDQLRLFNRELTSDEALTLFGEF